MEYQQSPVPETAPEETLREPSAPQKPRRKFFDARTIAYFGILTALDIVLLLWGSAIPVGAGGATLNFSLVPIVLGAILLGPVAGALLGLVAGVIILVMVVLGAQGAIFLALFNVHPVVIALVCLVKTTAAGLVSGLLYRLIRNKNQKAAVFTAAAAAPVVNTGLFILGLLCISGAVFEASSEVFNYTSGAAIIVLGFVGYNFFIEFAINLVLAPALSTVIRVVEKRFVKKKKKA